jgi:hypothetical protein
MALFPNCFGFYETAPHSIEKSERPSVSEAMVIDW